MTATELRREACRNHSLMQEHCLLPARNMSLEGPESRTKESDGRDIYVCHLIYAASNNFLKWKGQISITSHHKLPLCLPPVQETVHKGSAAEQLNSSAGVIKPSTNLL